MPKEALIVAGPNGAGKTTFAEEYVAEHPRPFLSADAIAERLNPARPAQARLQAGRAFFAELDAGYLHAATPVNAPGPFSAFPLLDEGY